MKAEIADRKHDCHKSRVDIYFVSGFRSNENRILNKLLSENPVCCLCFKHNRGIIDDRFLTNKSAHCVSVMLRSANPSIRRNELIKHRFPIYRRCSAPLHFPKQILTILCIKSADEGERIKLVRWNKTWEIIACTMQWVRLFETSLANSKTLDPSSLMDVFYLSWSCDLLRMA